MNTSMPQFYRDQLRSFERIGIGKKTNHGVVVTKKLIEVTERRLRQLSVLDCRIKETFLCERCKEELKSTKKGS
tara:strand:+ start:304 stop:525 length:222 start_codon:yes stop_codon:yes gene_type:complete